ncbi:MAG: hypothetical protein Q9M14_02810, partial [Mariprofundaceae bacterium]|nr:hypothetical protein [Mariprofundaceae bacterium]
MGLRTKGKAVFIFIIMLFSPCAMAGVISDDIKGSCSAEYQKYRSTVDYFAIRMRSYVETYGCGVVSAYGVFAENDMDRIEQWEDDPASFEVVNRVFLLSDTYGLNIDAKPALFDALAGFINMGSEDIIQRLESTLGDASRREIRRIDREPMRLLYLFWALELEPNADSRRVFKTYRKLQRDIPQSFLPMALMLDGQITTLYQNMDENIHHNISAKDRYEMIENMIHDYSIEFLERVASNRMALPNIIYLLPPQARDIPNLQGLTDNELDQLRRDYTSGIKNIVENLEQLTKNIGLSMEGMSFLTPYILDAMVQGVPIRDITTYLQAQVQSPVFHTYFDQFKHCTKEEFAQLFSGFFVFLAPGKSQGDNSKPIAINYLKHNLASIVRWYVEDSVMQEWVMHPTDPNRFVQNMAWLPYYRNKLNARGKSVMSDLMRTLSENVDTNATYILALQNSSGYFDWVQHSSDAMMFVTANEEVGDQSAKKYRYILTTPFPAQGDDSVFDHFEQDGKLYVGFLSQLQQESIDALEIHEFTNIEKWATLINTADNIATGLSIAAVPFTAGASLYYVGAKIAAKQAAKAT